MVREFGRILSLAFAVVLPLASPKAQTYPNGTVSIVIPLAAGTGMDTMVRIYKQQQLSEIEKMFTRTEFGMEENQDMLLNNRNKNWVKQLKTIMKKEPVFVAVGAGHLPGKEGVLELLRKEGYKLRGIRNN